MTDFLYMPTFNPVYVPAEQYMLTLTKGSALVRGVGQVLSSLHSEPDKRRQIGMSLSVNATLLREHMR